MCWRFDLVLRFSLQLGYRFDFWRRVCVLVCALDCLLVGFCNGYVFFVFYLYCGVVYLEFTLITSCYECL